MDLEIPSKFCAPERLLFMDHSHSGSIIRNLLAETSSLRLSKLKHLQIYCQGQQLRLLSKPLQTCFTALTTLEFYLSSLGAGKWFRFVHLFLQHPHSIIVPDTLNLRGLPMLSSLTLSADVSQTFDGDAGSQGLRRFAWLVNTLGTCHQPSRIENITFMILISPFGSVNCLPWQNLDVLFAQHPGSRWPALKCFTIQHSSECWWDVTQYNEGSLEGIILSMTPNLAAADLLRLMSSDEYSRFWRM
jgi:hypothetical protein